MQDDSYDPSGVDLEQIDIAQDPDEVFEQNIHVDEILEGLNWYPNFQVSILKKRKKTDKISNVFIDKLHKEMEESAIVLRRESANWNGEFDLQQFADMDIASLS